jgi:hypothetical protein
MDIYDRFTYKKLRKVENPAAWRGRLTARPSGKFCIPIPIARFLRTRRAHESVSNKVCQTQIAVMAGRNKSAAVCRNKATESKLTIVRRGKVGVVRRRGGFDRKKFTPANSCNEHSISDNIERHPLPHTPSWRIG